ncbi:hypothetical protein FisN_1Hh258 [Fistulifera solaris]|jgi:hypothetical protein|uniref:Uncharacterized protein n=1 Tax=Fistulifera solaris TaxID=1519565 RepID=A0A1Z5JEF3_FISSO|nr:hypothetical protein FisN_1Hh258 [Fistulifera solaris]|eukprot:GAX12326.1 hypothetical protein FisN_1Hh258 [Fistulifera solaris]
MEQSTLKRAAATAEVQDPALSTITPSTTAWEQQGVSKRPRLDEYRESTQESDDEEDDTDSKESSRSIANPRTASDNDASWSFSDSGLSGTEDSRRKERRWIVRKDSANPSVSSVITEVSDSEITSTMLGQDDDTSERRKNHRKGSQSIESVIRNMESWSVTHIRALRRNNVYENNRLSGTGAKYRTAVNNAKRDVMRTLRRSSDDNLSRSSSRGNLKDDASYTYSNDGATGLDRSPSPMDEL